jgi:hypothetical protein
MSVLLPNDAKYVLFCDNKQDFHHEWDFNWSFTFRLDGVNEPLTTEEGEIILTENGDPILFVDPNEQYAFCTFLSKQPTLSSALMGHYMGFFDNDENLNGEVAIAFDSTGLFASPGVPDRIIIRDVTGVIYNESLSSNIKFDDEQTLRFRYINKNEIAIDIKRGSFFDNIVRVSITTSLSGDDKIYPYFFYTTPVSSNTPTNVEFYLKNFHVQGNTDNPTFE